MNRKDKAVLYGLAIGDGHISYRTRLKDGKYRYEQAELIIGHSGSQKDYLEWKADELLRIFGDKRPKVAETTHHLKTTGKTYTGYRVAKTSPYFRQMHKELYKNDRKKVVTKEFLQHLNEVSVAIWFMDDGHIHLNKSKVGELTSCQANICTQVSEEEVDIICQWFFETFGLQAKKFKSKDKWDIKWGTLDSLKLVDLIIDHIHPQLLYKIKPLAKFSIRKSARHPSFVLDDDIVRSVKNKIDSVSEVNSEQ